MNYSSKLSSMAKRRHLMPSLFFLLLIFLTVLGVIVPVFALLPSLHSHSHPLFRHHHHRSNFNKVHTRKFEIDDDMFWKDGKPFQIIGGDLHYFRTLPEYWEDRLLRAKALGLNTIQTYIPWNLHEPKPGNFTFNGIANIVSFIQLCQKLDFLVLLRPGPYICAEWDLGGFPAWLLSKMPASRLRSSDPGYLQWVERWWGIILPKVAPLLYNNGGPIIMVQIENEFGSYGDDQAYLHHLVALARGYLGDEIILYTTDGGTRETLEKGTIRGNAVFSAVDFSTGERPWPIFNLQKEFNPPGKSPPLTAEFYTGWLTHWGENIATTDANSTAAALNEILAGKGSTVLYMAHGGTNFGFYNGANTGNDVMDYKPDLTSYDYDAPIKESGDVDNAKYEAIRRVIQHYSGALIPSIPPNNEKIGYGPIQLQKVAFLFDLIHMMDPVDVAVSEEPLSMESMDQSFGFLLYTTEYVAKDNEDGQVLFIPEVHDRAQVFLSCSSKNKGVRPTSVGIIERWSNRRLNLPNTRCDSNTLYILVENMGRINYGRYLLDRKGILSSVYLDNNVLHGWKMIPLPFNNLNEIPRFDFFSQIAHSRLNKIIAKRGLEAKFGNISGEPTLYSGYFYVDKANLRKDTYLSFGGWTKGIAFVNEFNLGRFWPVVGPQCNLYVPAPILLLGKNVLVILELESPNRGTVVHSVDRPDFTCGSSLSNLSQQLLSHQHSVGL